jgi:hypothetical protein
VRRFCGTSPDAGTGAAASTDSRGSPLHTLGTTLLAQLFAVRGEALIDIRDDDIAPLDCDSAAT